MAIAQTWTGAVDGTWDDGANWDPTTGGAGTDGSPGAGDTAIFNGRATRALTGNPTGAPKLAYIAQYLSCAYDFGTPTSPIAVGADRVELGLPDPSGQSVTPGEWHQNFGTNNGAKIYVYATKAQGATSEPVTFKSGTPASGTHALLVSGGLVGLATVKPADTMEVGGQLTVSGGRVNGGLGVTTATVVVNNGTLSLAVCTAAATITQHGGTLRTEGTIKFDTYTGNGGTYYLSHRASSGVDLETFTLNGATVDLTEDPEPVDVNDDPPSLKKGTIKCIPGQLPAAWGLDASAKQITISAA